MRDSGVNKESSGFRATQIDPAFHDALAVFGFERRAARIARQQPLRQFHKFDPLEEMGLENFGQRAIGDQQDALQRSQRRHVEMGQAFEQIDCGHSLFPERSRLRRICRPAL